MEENHLEYCSIGKEMYTYNCDALCADCSHLVKTSCGYCRGEKFTDSELLEFVLDKLVGISKEEATEKYLEESKKCKS